MVLQLSRCRLCCLIWLKDTTAKKFIRKTLNHQIMSVQFNLMMNRKKTAVSLLPPYQLNDFVFIVRSRNTLGGIWLGKWMTILNL